MDLGSLTALRDLDAIKIFTYSPAFLATLDIPWTPFFIAEIFILHPMLGWPTLLGGSVLLLVVLTRRLPSCTLHRDLGIASAHSDRSAELLRSEAETLKAPGMNGVGFERW
jgi:ATP-binding cassette subfamily C protein